VEHDEDVGEEQP
jgi:hypothetical protein